MKIITSLHDVHYREEEYQEQIVSLHLVQKYLINEINFHVYDKCPNYKQMFGQLMSGRNIPGYVGCSSIMKPACVPLASH